MSTDQPTLAPGEPSADTAAASACPKCGESMAAATVRSVFWRGDQPAIVDGIPAMTCGNCMESFYDDAVSEALRRLAERGFPPGEAGATVVVPVFSLPDHLAPRPPLPDDCYID